MFHDADGLGANLLSQDHVDEAHVNVACLLCTGTPIALCRVPDLPGQVELFMMHGNLKIQIVHVV